MNISRQEGQTKTVHYLIVVDDVVLRQILFNLFFYQIMLTWIVIYIIDSSINIPGWPTT